MLAIKRVLCGTCLLLGLSTLPAAAFDCNVNATGLNFGSYDVFSPVPLSTTGTVRVDCNIPPQNPHAPLAVTISLSPGNAGTFAQRWMQSTGSDRLHYNLYTDASMSSIWGDGGGTSVVQSAFVTRDTPWQDTIFGRIPARQNVRAGSYRDTIVITIDW
jgi:spore coat protein U-like protein